MSVELLTITEIAERLRVKLTTARRLVNSGRIPSINLGFGKRKNIRVRVSDLEAFLNAEVESTKDEKRGSSVRPKNAKEPLVTGSVLRLRKV